MDIQFYQEFKGIKMLSMRKEETPSQGLRHIQEQTERADHNSHNSVLDSFNVFTFWMLDGAGEGRSGYNH